VAFAKANAKAVVLTARDLSRLGEVEKEIRESYPNTKVLVHKTDVTSEADVKAAFAKAIEAFGSVDIAIHNAGLNSDFTPLTQTDTNVWWNQYVSGRYLGSTF
jgi:glucose 1-dehydrogenase